MIIPMINMMIPKIACPYAEVVNPAYMINEETKDIKKPRSWMAYLRFSKSDMSFILYVIYAGGVKCIFDTRSCFVELR